ncbi:hypothetical protein M513_04950 [Trichuris suis]|uniref:Fanconi anemia core complex-associated protein 24 pseudonuclease domain-containing protein n=1 Tax=Trichuris suis TaxID=68888 RepID=A0A085MAC7_9BILA|nr:hypothetical protein M513_04950 [Trichuris suis]
MKPVVVACEWRHEEFGKCLLASSKFHGQVRFTDEVKDVDFVITQVAVGIFVTCNNDAENMKARQKVVTMRRYVNDQIIGVVIVRRIANDTKNFIRLQQLATINFGFKTVIVTQVDQAARFVLTLAWAKHASVACEPTSVHTNEDLMKPLEKIPQLGPVRAKKLLQRFGSKHAVDLADSLLILCSAVGRVCTASVEELAEVVGMKVAEEVKQFVSRFQHTNGASVQSLEALKVKHGESPLFNIS